MYPIAFAGGAIFLLAMQRMVRRGVPEGSLTCCETVVLAHWPFIWLNALLIWSGAGEAWVASAVDPQIGARAAFTVTVGLVGFVLGAQLGVRRAERASASATPWRQVAIVGSVMSVVGTTALSVAILEGITEGLDARTRAFIAVGECTVPGAVCLWAIAVRAKHISRYRRFLAGGAALISTVVLAFGWSRRSSIAVLAAVAWMAGRQAGARAQRRVLLWFVPAAVAAAISLLIVRRGIYRGQWVEFEGMGEVLTFYGDRLWIETSAFSALLVIVDEYGLWEWKGGASMAAGILFWLPRSVAPGKPRGLDLGELVGTAYTIGVPIHGEVLLNFTIVGVAFLLAALGILLKWLDQRSQRMPEQHWLVYLYPVFLVDSVFLVRGSFQATAAPFLIHAVITAAGFSILRLLEEAARTARSR